MTRRPIQVTPKELARLEALLGSQTVRTDMPMAASETLEDAPRATISRQDDHRYVPHGLGEASHQRIAAGSPCRCGTVTQDRYQWCSLPGMGPCAASDWLCADCALAFKAALGKPKSRKPRGKKSTARGTDLG